MDYETLREVIELTEGIIEKIEYGELMSNCAHLEFEIDDLDSARLSKLYKKAETSLDEARENFEDLLSALNKSIKD
jgi:exonuclease VII small subunit